MLGIRKNTNLSQVVIEDLAVEPGRLEPNPDPITRAMDRHSFFADPDPAAFLIADPDPAAF